MQNVGQSDNKKLENKLVSAQSTSSSSSLLLNSSGGNGKTMSTPLNQFSSSNSSPAKSDTETYSEFQPRVTDSSESDEESVSEVRQIYKKKFKEKMKEKKNSFERKI